MIYFDNAATTLIKPKSVFDTLYDLSVQCGSFGRSLSKPSCLSASVIYDTRQQLCRLFDIDKPENIVFTYNATYALNLAIKSLITEPCTVITTTFEHNSVIRPLKALERKGVQMKIIIADLYDHESFIEKFIQSIDKNTKFAVVNHISNAFGYILPIKEIDEICQAHDIKLILDVSQSAGILPISLTKLSSVCAICMPAHKSLYGPLGVGMAIFKEETMLEQSVIEGGTGSMSDSIDQPRFLPDMLEAGTPNAPAIGALGKGISYILQKEDIAERLFLLARYFHKEISKINNTYAYFCDDKTRQSGVVSFYHPRMDSETVAELLAEKNICTRAGIHCAPLAHHIAKSYGTVRVSFSTFNDFWEIDEFCSCYQEIIKKNI